MLQESYKLEGSTLIKKTQLNGWAGSSYVDLDQSSGENLSGEESAFLWDSAYQKGKVRFPKPERTKVVRIADVFCGAGGLSLGLKMAAQSCGLDPQFTLAMDTDATALDVYMRNFQPTHSSLRNIWTSVTTTHSKNPLDTKFIQPPEILNDEIKDAVGKVDILIGGPPCQGHSTSNNHTMKDDPRNKLYIAMPALAVALGAKAVVVENVPGVKNDNGNVLEVSKRLFKSSGYNWTELVLPAVDLGLPQTRKRHILVAAMDESPSLKEIVEKLYRPERDLRWAIGDLNGINSTNIFDSGADLSVENKERIDFLIDNDLYDLPDHKRPVSHRNGNTYPSIYGRLSWEKPSGTITTGFNTPGRGRYIHPEKRRTITPHEAARIQGFPDNFEFKLVNGDELGRSSLGKLIGDAVPPQMGYAGGLAALSSMTMDSLSNV